MNLGTDLKPLKKSNSKWTIGLNVKHKTVKLLEDNVVGNLDVLGFGDGFLDTAVKAQSTNKKFISCMLKLKTPLRKDSIKRMKRQATEWEKIFAKETTDKGLISKIYKQLMELNIKKNKQFN